MVQATSSTVYLIVLFQEEVEALDLEQKNQKRMVLRTPMAGGRMKERRAVVVG